MYASINSDTRFVLPNSHSRIGDRADAASARTIVLRERHEDAPLVLTSPASVNWRTGGLSDPVDRGARSDPVWVVDAPHGHALITSEIEAPRLESDFTVTRRGWELVAVPWYDDAAMCEAALAFAQCDQERVLSDSPDFGLDVHTELVSARLALSEAERADLRELGALAGRALSAGVDVWRPGISTDYEIAAAVASALEAEGAHAVCLIVGGDERLRRLRHPLGVGQVLHEAVMAVVVARRAGLHVAATRTCVRDRGDEIVSLHSALAQVDDAVLAASLPGGTWGETLSALEDAYGAVGHEGAWREHFQGGPIGFEQREFEIAPCSRTSPFWHEPRRLGTAVAWNPSFSGGAKIEDTYLVGEDGLELVTASPGWPTRPAASGGVRHAPRILE